MAIGKGIGIGIGKRSPLLKGVPAIAWRFATNQPVKKAAGGYWLRSAS